LNNKNVCVLSHGPVRDDVRVQKIINTLAGHGFNVWVFYPDVPNNDKEQIANLNNIAFVPVTGKNNLYRKTLRHSLYFIEFSYLFKTANSFQVNFSYIYVNDLPALFAGRLIQKHNPGSRLIYDSHEIFNETINQFLPVDGNSFKAVASRWLVRFMRTTGTFYERMMARKVDLFITVNNSLKDYFEGKYKISDVKVIMNYPALEKKNNTSIMPVIDFRLMYNWEKDSRLFLYHGTWNKGRGLELLIQTFKLTPEQFKLVIIGKGILGKRLHDDVRSLGLENRVKLIDFVSSELLPNYTKAADVGINLLEPYNLSKAMASPNKLFEYIHAGIPVVCSNTKENRAILEKYDVGILVENNHESLLEGLFYFNSSENIRSKSKSLPEAAGYYSWENRTDELISFFKKSKD
jgi:glycosyltransferase involved in cell wall biosynthesis